MLSFGKATSDGNKETSRSRCVTNSYILLQPSATEDTIKVIADGEATVISDLRMDDSSDDDDMSVNNNNSSRASSGKNTTSGATSLSGDQVGR